jgi:hypothetical protein
MFLTILLNEVEPEMGDWVLHYLNLETSTISICPTVQMSHGNECDSYI